jgi:Sds3-like
VTSRKILPFSGISEFPLQYSVVHTSDTARLFADRNTQLNRELSRIQSDPPTHPEYLSMVKAVDRLRNERIDHAKTLYRYKLQALQRKAVVTRATLQSQYMQRIREQRDKCLEQASEEWYQIQRERRNFDTDKDAPLTHFTGERPQWVAAQTAYNTEVSILSGVAKYVGFPAAPEIRGATSAEMDEDLRKMGVCARNLTPLDNADLLQISRQTAPSVVSAALPPVGKPKSGAEEQFIAETAWANPQHQQSQYLTNVHRQISNNLRPASPVSTPAAQKRSTDPAPNGSASTVPVHPSSSLAPTPMSVEPHGTEAGHPKSNLYAGAVSVTPSKPAEQIAHKPDTIAENGLQEIAQVPEPPTSNARTTDAVTAGVKASSPPPQQPPQSLETAPPAQMPPGVQVGSV